MIKILMKQYFFKIIYTMFGALSLLSKIAYVVTPCLPSGQESYDFGIILVCQSRAMYTKKFVMAMKNMPVMKMTFQLSGPSAAATTSSVFSTESGFKLIEPIPCSTKKRANSG